MDLGIRGRVALVAAASKGIGRAIADALAAEGARLAICARGEGALTAAASQIAAAHDAEVLPIVADVAEPRDIERLVGETRSRFGRVDILVTNSGGPPSGRFDALAPEQFEEAGRLLLGSVVRLARAVLPSMRERRWGRIINVTSIAAKQPVDGLILSNSLRAAVLGFARTLANEVAAEGITVNNILPGYTRTERVEELAQATAARESLSAHDIQARWEREIPMRRLAEPREVAALAAFLASEPAGYITASSIAVDGGWIRSLL